MPLYLTIQITYDQVHSRYKLTIFKVFLGFWYCAPYMEADSADAVLKPARQP